ncbi:hypothetical protein BH11PSE1_BH11PSE1_10580 [soil metagenome]
MMVQPQIAPRTAFAFPRGILKTADQVRRELRVPELPRPIGYALIRRPEYWLEKPVAFPTLADLAAALHRDRAGRPIQLADVRLPLRDEAAPRSGVSVWTCVGGDRERFLGWCWLHGAGWRVLQAALDELQPQLAGAEG